MRLPWRALRWAWPPQSWSQSRRGGPVHIVESDVMEPAGRQKMIDAALGIKGSLHYSDQLDNPDNERFVAGYRDKYGEGPTVYAVQAYDAAAVLDQALASGTTGEAIVAGLEGVGEVDSPRGRWTHDAPAVGLDGRGAGRRTT